MPCHRIYLYKALDLGFNVYIHLLNINQNETLPLLKHEQKGEEITKTETERKKFDAVAFHHILKLKRSASRKLVICLPCGGHLMASYEEAATQRHENMMPQARATDDIASCT